MLLNKFVIFLMPMVPKPIVRFFAKRYVAGDKLQDAVDVVKKLNQNNIMATIDLLGESATKIQECEDAINIYDEILNAIETFKLTANISIKPTQLGLLIDKELCYNNIVRIADNAKKHNNFVRIDMEDSSCTHDTIDIFEKILKTHTNVGIVLQAYLRRSVSDIQNLAKQKGNFRLCKGIYIEPREIAYKDGEIVNNNFAQLVETAFRNNCYAGIATHDEKVVWQALKLIDEYNLSKDEYEFQMLLGVDEQLRNILVKQGHRMRVYVPFGKKWYAYSMRRLKENPKIAIYTIKAIFKKR